MQTLNSARNSTTFEELPALGYCWTPRELQKHPALQSRRESLDQQAAKCKLSLASQDTQDRPTTSRPSTDPTSV